LHSPRVDTDSTHHNIGNMNHFDSPKTPIYPVMDTLVQRSHQLQRRPKERRYHLALRRIHLVSASEEPIANFDTALMFAVKPGEIAWQQNDILIDAMVQDITRRVTLQFPAIALALGEQAKSDQRQVITKTAGNAAIAGAGDLIYAVLRFLINVVMTNIVSVSVYGTYTAVYTAASIVGSVTMLGLDSTMVRFLSAYSTKSERGLAAGLIRFVVWMTLISGLLCGALFFLSATVLAHLVYHKDAYALPLKEVALLIPLLALQGVLCSGLQALNATKWKVYVGRVIQPSLTLVLLGVFYLLGLQLEALILATICGFLASAITGQVLMRKASKWLVYHAVPRLETKIWLRFALPLSLNSLIQNVLNSTDVLFLAAFSTSAQVGLYAVADRLSSLVVMPFYTLNTIFLPQIAEYYARGEHEQLSNMAKVVTKWMFTLSLPVFLCFCVFHDAILSIFSRSYIAAGAALIILSFGNLIDAGTGSTSSLLVMAGYGRLILANTAATIIINIGLAFWLVPRFNIIGAAVAAAMAVIIFNIAYFIEVYWLLKIITLRWDMLKPVAAGAVASIVGFLLLQVIQVGYGYRAIFGTTCLLIPFMLVYGLVIVLLGFSKEDMIVIDAVRAKFGKKQSA
jgi:O-antigen/teichoic acid export membrane protein